MSKKKSAPKGAYVYVETKKGAEPEKMGSNQFAAWASRKLKVTEPQAKELFNLAHNGEELELDPEMDAKMAATLEKAWATVQGIFEYSAEHQEKLEEQAKEAEKAEAEAEEQFSKTLALISAKGQATSKAVLEESLATTGRVLSKFDVTETGLSPKADTVLTFEDAVGAVAYLLADSETTARLGRANTWQKGDAILIMEGFDRGAEMLEQMVEVTGNQKHTVQQARRVCAAFPQSHRFPELSYTHYHEAFNYSKLIKPAALKKILERCAKGDKESGFKPWSTKRLRVELQKAAGLSQPEPKDSKEPAVQTTVTGKVKDLFIYVDDEGRAFHSPEFDPDAASESVLVFEVGSMAILSKTGGAIGPVPRLDMDRGFYPGLDPADAGAEEEEESGIPV